MSNKPTIRVVIADDHALIREGLKHLLSNDGLKIVGEAATAFEIFSVVRATKCDLLILDLSMPGQTGLDSIRLLKRDHPDLRVLVLSVFDERLYAVRCIKAGASGYVNKQEAPAILAQAVWSVMRSGRYLSDGIADLLVQEVQTVDHGHRLSDREFDVLRGIVLGKSPSMMAGELRLSVKTISTYRTRLLNKIGATTNAELVAYALRDAPAP